MAQKKKSKASPGKATVHHEPEVSEVPSVPGLTEVECERCGQPMVIRVGKLGRFLACSASHDPDIACKNTHEFKEVDGKIVVVKEGSTDEVCEQCGRPMLIKSGRFGRFLACSGYPECKVSRPLSIGVDCPECEGGFLTERRSARGKVFFGCHRYPDCRFVAWDRPLAGTCPDCGARYLLQKVAKRGAYAACPDKECGYKSELSAGQGPVSADS